MTRESAGAWMFVVAAAVGLALGCGPGKEKEPEPPPAREAAAGAPRGVSGPPSEALFARLARGELSFGDLVDPELGVVYVAVFEDVAGDDARAGEDGLVRVAERVCGPRLSELGGRLVDRLRWRDEETGEAPALECRDGACTQPALAEYDLDTTWIFAEEDGRIRLDRVIQIEGGPVTETFTREARAWAEEQARRLAGTRCSP